MSKDVNFKIKLLIDGKETIVEASTNAKELAKQLGYVKYSSDKVRDSLIKFNQGVEVFKNINSAVSQITSTLNNLTAESREFTAAMKAANTMAGKDSAGFNQLKNQITDLAATIPMARDQLANGLYQVISNGIPEDNWIEYLRSSARSAIGGIADVGEVVKVTSTIIKNYGLEWSAAQDIQDKIQLTAKNGVTSFEQLAAALPSVTGQAAQLGVSLTEMLAVMSTLTGVTGNTNEVATQLASVLTALTKESSKSQKMAEAMGISFNAASIKAAGGLKNFLQELDKTVTQYSEKTGQLRDSIYAKLFGRAEALRLVNALTGQLAQKYDENIQALDDSVGTMDAAFTDMASTGSAKIQLLNNKFADLRDLVSSVATGMLPTLNVISQLGFSVQSIFTLSQAFLKLRGIIVSSEAAIVGLKVAIRGLGVATGVGVAIVALTMLLEKLFNVTVDTADSTRRLEAADDAFKQTYADNEEVIKRRLDDLDKLIKAKEDTATAVSNLAKEYPNLVNAQMSGAEAYDALLRGSKDYCTQLALEAKAEQLKTQLIGLNSEKAVLAQKKIDLQRQGKDKETKFGIWDESGYSGRGSRSIGLKTVSSKDYRALEKQEAAIIEQEKVIQNELDLTIRAAESMKSSLTDGVEDVTSALKVEEMTWNQLDEAISETTKSLKDTTDPAKIADLKSYNEQLKKQKSLLEAKLGMGSTKGAPNEKKLVADPQTYDDFKNNIAYYQQELEKTNQKDNYRITVLSNAKAASERTAEAIKKLAESLSSLSTGDNDPITPILEKSKSALEKIKDTKIELQVEFDQERIRAITDEWLKMQKQMSLEAGFEGVAKIAGAVDQLGQSMTGLAGESKALQTAMAGVSLAAAIAQLVAVMVKKLSESFTIWDFIAGTIAGTAAVVGAITQLKSVAAFAQGGIVNGPTMALVGEYANARSNPEVITPLDRLRSMIQPAGFDGGLVRFEIDGRKLVGVIEKEYNHARRS